MSFPSLISTLSLIFYINLVTAQANPLDTPCTTDTCECPLSGQSGSQSSGTIKLWGPEGTISDIAPVSGWEILECDPDAIAQEVRLVCADESAHCDHLYGDAGPEGKIVRLPPSCGASAFARVVSERDCEDQTLPASSLARAQATNGTQPVIKILQVDTDFAAVQSRVSAPIRFAIQAANIPGLDNVEIPEPTALRARSRHFGRGAFDWVGALVDKIKELTAFDTGTTTELPPLNIDQQYNLLDEHVSCSPFDAALKIDVGAKANAIVAIGVVASGTIVPPSIDEFSLVASLTADINGVLGLVANVSGKIDTGDLTIFQSGLPGLDFPGFLTVGPTFMINAHAIANLDVDMQASVGLNYQVQKAQFTFPPTNSTGLFEIGKTPLKVNVSPMANTTGDIEAHIVPKLTLGINAFAGTAKANVYLSLDASAGMTMDFDMAAEASATVQQVAPEESGSVIAAQAGASVDGCLNIFAGLDVNLGADANFFGLWDGVKETSLYSQDWELYQKCLGTATPNAPARRSLLESRQLGNLICPALGGGDASVPIVDGEVTPTPTPAA